MKQLYVLILLAAILLQSCWEAFEYSPNQSFDKDSARGLNAQNLQLLYEQPSDDTITIAFVGDSQRFYDELDQFIDTVNRIPSIDFVLFAGDISDFGLLQEFKFVHDMLSDLNKPYFGVVGNHDVLAKGEEVFERMFGPLNFSFTYQGVKFVCHNTNSKEYNNGHVPHIPWLRKELVASDSAQYFIPVSHVPPFSRDFDKNLEAEYTALFHETPGLLISLHGHIHEHRDGYPYGDGVRYMTSHSFDQKAFVLLKISSGQVSHSIINY
jgi:3',5'-cyclic-AMP phosphodiesterase